MRMLHLPRADQVATAALAATASFLTLLSWNALSDNASAYLVPLFWVCVLTATAGLALRAVGTPRLVVPALQATGVGLFLHHLWAAPAAIGGWLPTSTSLELMWALVEDGAQQATMWPAPVPANVETFPVLMLATGAAVVLLVDALACSLQRVAVSGLPLLAAFTVPVSILGGVPWTIFAVGGLAYSMLLASDQATRLGRWGRSLAPMAREHGGAAVHDNQPHQVRLGTVWPNASRFAVAGVAIAVLAPLALPESIGMFQAGGSGSGPGAGDGVSLRNPLVTMQRRLNQRTNVPLVTVQTDDPKPSYLRIVALDRFEGTAWLPSDRELPPNQRVDGEIPLPLGLSPDASGATYTTRLDVSPAFSSAWLPAPYPAVRGQVPGDWRYDLDTLDFRSADDDVTTAGLSYQFVGQAVRDDQAAMVSAPPAPRSIFLTNTELPETLPPWIGDLADNVTESGRSQFEKAVLLQRWFQFDGGFEYSTERVSGSGLRQLELFLGTGEGSRIGYCEQFSAAMAMMARTLGIPARVAVGFLRPEPLGDGRWVYGSHDLHAWPELYFQGSGWVTFEPTPQSHTEAVPAYTVGEIPAPEEVPSTDPTASVPSDLDSPSPSADVGSTPGAQPTSSQTAAWAWGAGALLLLAGLVALPRMLRLRRRRRRLAPSGPRDPHVGRRAAEDAWAELRATALDLGVGWDDGATLRQRARGLVGSLAGERGRQPARAALERLVLLLERSRYSRAGLDAGQVDEALTAVREVLDSLWEHATPAARRRATWLPASLWRERRMWGRPGAPERTDRDESARRAEDLEKLSV